MIKDKKIQQDEETLLQAEMIFYCTQVIPALADRLDALETRVAALEAKKK